MKNIAIYPGSFDPPTYGHLDIIQRASKLYDKVYVVIGINTEKNYLFTLGERVELLKEVTKEFDNVEIDTTGKLIVEYARQMDSSVIIRGLRAVSDFEYELNIATTNQFLDKGIETVFLMAKPNHSFLSSSVTKEIAKFRGNLDDFVPKCVEAKLREKVGK